MPGRQEITDLEVQMRAGGVAGTATQGDQLAAGDVLPRVDDELVVVEVRRPVVRMVDDHPPAPAVAPFAVDHRAVVGGDHRGIGGYGEIRTPMAVVRVTGRAVEADHGPVVLSGRVVMVHPGRDPGTRVRER